MRIPQKMQFSWFVGIGDNSDLQILLLYLKNVTAHELEAQWGHGREIHCSEGWLWPPPSAQLLSQSHQEPAQASTKTKIIIPPSNIPGTFPKVKTFLPQVCYFNALFIYWSVKIIKFFGQTMIISCDNLSEWHSHTFFFFPVNYLSSRPAFRKNPFPDKKCRCKRGKTSAICHRWGNMH